MFDRLFTYNGISNHNYVILSFIINSRSNQIDLLIGKTFLIIKFIQLQADCLKGRGVETRNCLDRLILSMSLYIKHCNQKLSGPSKDPSANCFTHYHHHQLWSQHSSCALLQIPDCIPSWLSWKRWITHTDKKCINLIFISWIMIPYKWNDYQVRKSRREGYRRLADQFKYPDNSAAILAVFPSVSLSNRVRYSPVELMYPFISLSV